MTSPALMLCTNPCVIHKVTLAPPDEYGDQQQTTTEIEALCELQQARSSEARGQGLVVVTQWNLYGFADPATGAYLEVNLTANDQITIDGTRYAVQGTPWRVRDPLLGITDHVEAVLQEVTVGQGSTTRGQQNYV